ncbi:MAG: PAS domain S-box protein [Bryobacterales bacterium]|nr:PAS domain S-box protein [Bryobacterales bacterium]MBV9396345.1 PAS domain S-box protein [Bryobacterales bacterium]
MRRLLSPDRPISQKLLIITMVTTAAALLLTGLGILLADSILFRQYLQRDLLTLARIVAENSTAALQFNDPDVATQTLRALRARTNVDGACIYRPDGTILAKYSRLGSFSCPSAYRGTDVRFGNDLTVSQPIILDGRKIGTLTLSYNLQETWDRVKLYGGVVLAVLLLASVVAFFVSAKLRSLIATPIARLVSATTSVAETGDYSIRAAKVSQDELGVLVDRFNEMLNGIQSRDSDLKSALFDRELALRQAEEERQRFRFMAESMPQKIFTAAPDGNMNYLNAQWMEFSGLSFDQMSGTGWIQLVHPDDLEDNLTAWQHSINTGDPFHYEHRFRAADGKYRWHLSRAHAMRDATGRITMWIGSSTDIDEQKEKEAELQRANEDLQQFAYSASHDLQEPIRNVAVYSEIVAQRYRDALDGDGQIFLGFLQEGGRRLATLVNDLLAYTRASMAELSQTPVDANAVLKNSLASLAEAIRESQAEITYDPLPEVFMGEAHLQQVLQNLVANALKYRSDQEPPRIHVSADSRGSLWCFSVRDNGIGIEPQYKEKIFGVFKRLRHDRKYSGTGIGLAICQRVVERYGGRIWVESEVGKGSTFFFTVPRRAQPVRPAALQSSAS